LVDFWAPWCQPCLMMAPILENISQKYQDKLEIKKLILIYHKTKE